MLQIGLTLIIATVFVILLIKALANAGEKRADKKAEAARRAAADAEIKAAEDERRKWEARRKAEREEWESKHGRFTSSVAGVTFDNEDGTLHRRC